MRTSSVTIAAVSLFTLALLPASLSAQQPGAPPRAPAERSMVNAATGALANVSMGLVRDPRIVAALRDISPARIRATDSTLVAFGTRHTMSDTMSTTRGIGAARRYIAAAFSRYSAECGGCLRVEFDPAMITIARHPQKPTVNVVNVLAWLPGRDTSRVVVMGTQYDSCICNVDRWDATSDAPGADDDGSGTSALMELVRVFSKRFPRGLDATVLFVAYAAEEQGLLGSTHLAQKLHDAGYKVVAGMTDDIAGNVVADDGRVDSTTVRVFSGDPDNGPSRELSRYVWALSTLYTPGFNVLPVSRLDRIGRGGDHIPFHLKGDAAVRFSERLENYKRQHLPTDDFANVNFGYVANVARLNGATVGALAAAPAVPDSAVAQRDAKSGGQKWLMSWKPVPGALSYEVLVRRTTSPLYEKIIPVGNVTSYLLPDQLDDTWAAVRSVGADGARSLAASVPPPSFVTR